jgi:hypothetical protein
MITERRLVILAVEPGQDPEIDWEGEWAYWELYAVLDRAASILEEREAEEANNGEEPE